MNNCLAPKTYLSCTYAKKQHFSLVQNRYFLKPKKQQQWIETRKYDNKLTMLLLGSLYPYILADEKNDVALTL